jgi:hypothetical protein
MAGRCAGEKPESFQTLMGQNDRQHPIDTKEKRNAVRAISIRISTSALSSGPKGHSGICRSSISLVKQGTNIGAL